ncbi:hypothetical protein RGQ30_26720 [Limnobacter thiooxidans]|uniref:Uncharacterized protein n=1 Tax=Limnobacter thiooxidans TaxID=131080 RepID=A0AA86JHE8_9BURK|nr:hypothetical protein RGQ30_26720 [Limnobacter thiooxidans]
MPDTDCWAGLGWAGLGWAGLGWAGLGWAGLGWAGLGWAGLLSSGWFSLPNCLCVPAGSQREAIPLGIDAKTLLRFACPKQEAKSRKKRRDQAG